MATQMSAPKRTEGDGMESGDDAEKRNVSELTRKLSTISTSSIPKEEVHKSSLIHLKPSIVPRRKVSTPRIPSHTKQPKFVPYEPYKAAVKPIVPSAKRKKASAEALSKALRQRNVSYSSDYKSDNEHKEVPSKCDTESSDSEELKRLREENKELEKQLKFQVQVNGELKNLLVAAVGEDMEVRMNSLTEDKLHLAQALLNSAKTLSTHQEQVEWLASQCEVWRSKFLASSVMVEEMARWKAALTERINDGQDVIRQLLEERKIVRKNLLEIYVNLTLLRDSFHVLSMRKNLKTSNVLDLSLDSNAIVSGLMVQLLGGERRETSTAALQQLPHSTEGEKAADYILKNPHLLQLIGEPDAACSAVVGAAVALNSQLFRQSIAPHVACCSQCSGNMKLV